MTPRTETELNQVNELIDKGRLGPAEAQLVRMLRRQPAEPNVNSLMSYVAALVGKSDQALYYAEKAHRAAPDHPGLHANYGRALAEAGRFDDAFKVLDALRVRGTLGADVHAMVINALIQAGRLDEALGAAREAARTYPDSSAVQANLAQSLQQLGHADEALAHWRRAADLAPREVTAAGDLVACALYTEDGADARTAHARADLDRVEAALRRTLGVPRPAWRVTPDPDRPLRIGLLSADMRRHAMAFFIEPILRHYDRGRWDITCYYLAAVQDDVTRRLRSLAAQWRHEHATPDSLLAERIRDDRIDVLLDLCAHTAGNRPNVLHLRPAPVQASLIVCPGTLGMSSVPWRITDSATDPPGEPWPGTEQLIRIDPCSFAYTPSPDAPDPAPPPVQQLGTITFGSFSAMQKWTDATVELYAGALKAVPRSRLLVRNANLHTEGVRNRLRDRLVRAGAPAERLLIEPPLASPLEALAEYSRVDIALDTFPYHGMTTTCEALWMGVPMIVLRGRTSAARVGCCILQAVGLDRLIADSPDQYIRTAAALAADLPTLRAWRCGGPQSLRARMAASPLCDGEGYCRRLEAGVRQAWRSWCAAQGASQPS